MADLPPQVRRVNPILRLFSSIPFGVILLVLIFSYAAVVSALAPVRYAVEMTEMQIFRHWIFATLVALFCVCLSVTTWRRIRWNVTNLGVLTVHAGLLLLIGGSTAYFWGKIEGDVLMMAPAVQLVRKDSPDSPIVQLPAQAGEAWQAPENIPIGRVRFEVVSTTGDDMRAVTSAVVRVTIGDETKDITLDGANAELEVRGSLLLRLRPSSVETQFYDREEPALYWRPVANSSRKSDDGWRSAAIPGLPMYLERFLPSDAPLRDSVGREVVSNRTSPALRIGPLSIPTGWIESWRMPIDIPLVEAAPFDIKVTGYLPAVRGMDSREIPAPPDDAHAHPVIDFKFEVNNDAHRFKLVAGDPRRSLIDSDPPLDFVWVSDDVSREEALRPLAGPHELTVEVKEPPLRRTFVAQPGQTIQVDGTPYELAVNDFQPRWPLVSPGFERAVSPAALIAVNTGTKRFTRAAIARFPELSQDIDASGMRKRDGPIDANIIITYRTCAQGALRLVAGPQFGKDARPELGVYGQTGRVRRFPLGVGAATAIQFGRDAVQATVTDVFFARLASVPIVEAAERRNISNLRDQSMIRLEFTGRDSCRDWKKTEWCSYSNFRSVDATPLLIDGPDGRNYEFKYSRQLHELGGGLAFHGLSVKYKPGRQSVDWWRSDFRARVGDEPPYDAYLNTNLTHIFNGWTLFQESAPGREPYFVWTVLGVGNRRGIGTMVGGCIMITLGSLYAFYVKPWLRRRRAAAALADAQRRGLLRPRAAAEDLLEVGR